MRALVAVATMLLAGCGAPAVPATLDRLRAYGFSGAAGETVEALEQNSRSSHLAAADEPPAAVVEVDGLLRVLLPVVLDRFPDPRAATLAARLRALPPQHTWDQIRSGIATLGPALDVWEPDLPPGELARFSSDRNVAAAATPISPRTAVVVSIRSVIGLFTLFTRDATVAAAPPATAPIGRESSLCPSEIADLAVELGAPRDHVQSAVHDVVRAVRVADTSPASSATAPPCTPRP